MRLFLLLLCLLVPLAHAETLTVALDDGTEIPLQRFAGGGDRLLWLPSEYGLRRDGEAAIAADLAALGFDVWLADLHGAWFLSPGRTSYNDVDPAAVAGLVEQVRPDAARLYLLTSGRGAPLLLSALRRWRLDHPDAPPLGGVLLLYPNLSATGPEPGQPTRYLPIAAASNLPIFVFQPVNSARRWHLPGLLEQLAAGGSSVYAQLLEDSADGFQSRPDATDQELAMRKRLPALVRRAARLLDQHNQTPRPAVARLPEDGPLRESEAAPERLQPFPGEPAAPPTRLLGLDGTDHDLAEYRGRVVLLNFWATWCPPCVKEVPSLGRLQERFADRGFVVLGASVGESAATVREFLGRVPAAFPVMLDPQGSAVPLWEIRAFPTSFLIDRDGQVRYGYFGALEWDRDEVVGQVEALL